MTLASFKGSGTLPDMLSVIISRKVGLIMWAAEFNILALIPPKPDPLLECSDLIIETRSGN